MFCRQTELLGHSVLPQYGTLTSALGVGQRCSMSGAENSHIVHVQPNYPAISSTHDASPFNHQIYNLPLSSAVATDQPAYPWSFTPSVAAPHPQFPNHSEPNDASPDASLSRNSDQESTQSSHHRTVNKRRRVEEPKALRACNVCKKASAYSVISFS